MRRRVDCTCRLVQTKRSAVSARVSSLCPKFFGGMPRQLSRFKRMGVQLVGFQTPKGGALEYISAPDCTDVKDPAAAKFRVH